MPLAAGEQLGPYRIVAAIGAGGMGEVFRARDTRLERDVAVKILPAAFSSDAERRKRFQNEIRAVAALSHPNILVVHDTGEHQGAPFLVTELLEGTTLRERLREGPLPPRKAVEWAAQLARGVAAAHDAGVIHRDLKPENVFLTRQDTLKVLDFGIAHLERTPREAGDETASALTASGAVLGTAGYMAPEQVRGGTLDFRADIFAFGAVVYEMLTGQRAFPGQTGIDRGHAILNLDPPNLHSLAPGLSPAIAALVARCLEKDPSQRFQSMRDVGFALEAVRETTGATESLAAPRGRGLMLAGALGGIAALGLGAWLALRARPEAVPPTAQPSFQRLTFRRGTTWRARFAPDQTTVIFGASWGGEGTRVYSAVPGVEEVRPLTEPGADFLDISPTSELAVRLDNGVLGRMPITGAAIRPIAEDVCHAQWDSHGQLMIVRHGLLKGTGATVEYPPGNVVFTAATSDALEGGCELSHKGDQIACVHLPSGYHTGSGMMANIPGSVILLSLDGQMRQIGGEWQSIFSLVWSPDDSELWIAASRKRGDRKILALRMDGSERVVLSAPGDLYIADVASNYRALVGRGEIRVLMHGSAPGQPERELTWLNQSQIVDITRDGRQLLFNDTGGVYLRTMEGSPAVRISDGEGRAISPDGRTALVCPDPPLCSRLRLVPTGPGSSLDLPAAPVTSIARVRFMRDGRSIVFGALDPQGARSLWIQPLDGVARRLTGPGVTRPVPSPDGRWIAAVRDQDSALLRVAVETGEITQLGQPAGLKVPIGWLDADSLIVWVGGAREELRRIDVKSGTHARWRILGVPEKAGFEKAINVVIADDGSYAYSTRQMLGDLYLVEGLR